ncbi:hypothetical protein AVEN_72986-1 [Araneus ventricosus]|uniref:Uncharacterized protein n=1 Tax=Araneus ventricosus TaxID=182803 RepID=A0A4Y2V2W3_ARAVE|nr:hypothetical protein AVEN_72986-1 [Araneus ventricosus]
MALQSVFIKELDVELVLSGDGLLVIRKEQWLFSSLPGRSIFERPYVTPQVSDVDNEEKGYQSSGLMSRFDVTRNHLHTALSLRSILSLEFNLHLRIHERPGSTAPAHRKQREKSIVIAVSLPRRLRTRVILRVIKKGIPASHSGTGRYIT